MYIIKIPKKINFDNDNDHKNFCAVLAKFYSKNETHLWCIFLQNYGPVFPFSTQPTNSLCFV